MYFVKNKSLSAKAFYHSFHRSMVCPEELQNHSGDPDTASMKKDQCKNHCNSEQNSGNQPPEIATFIRCQPLQKSVKDQRKHHYQNRPKPGAAPKNCNGYACHHTDELACTPGADRKLLSPEIERTIRSGMTAEKNLQESSEFSMLPLQFLPHP